MGSTRGAFTQKKDPTPQQQPQRSNKAGKGHKPHKNSTKKNGDSDSEDSLVGKHGHESDAFDVIGGHTRDNSDMENGMKYNSVDSTMGETSVSKYPETHDAKGHQPWYLFGENEEPLLQYTLRSCFYDPSNPEFTTLQQMVWSCVIGVFMGIFTAVWGEIIGWGVELIWEKFPTYLLKIGVFTDLEGHLPLPYYMVIMPSVSGGILAYISAIQTNPIPGQNEWIESLHRIGVMDHRTFFHLFSISTLGMMSGLSLGPELPLVLTAGMVGSYLALKAKQSVLSARVMNLTAAGAAIGGFFGFPMAGALFVLEIPHRMGLQYFEALTPATMASIVSVIFNRIWTKNDVTGYFNYPFLTNKLPSHIFYIAIVYGLVGCASGAFYAEGVLYLKGAVHDWFHEHDHHDGNHIEDKQHEDAPNSHGETVPLVGNSNAKLKTVADNSFFAWYTGICNKLLNLSIKNEPKRATVAGVIAGAITGLICMFYPHLLFWGEAQLQTLIDNGKTPLPIFGEEGEPTADLTAYGYCMVSEEDSSDAEGFGIACSAIFTAGKVLTIGLSLGTGIIGGHFWGPLFTGAAASNFFVSLMRWVYEKTGYGGVFSSFPTVAVLCIMGSTHVVTFRAHTAIMLVLTLTISAFSPENGSIMDVAGDYSAVFPLLVISVTVSLLASRKCVFYKKQRSRGDIIATPDVLCEPNKEGEIFLPSMLEPSFDYYPDEDDFSSFSDNELSLQHSENSQENNYQQDFEQKPEQPQITQEMIEQNFLNSVPQAPMMEPKVSPIELVNTNQPALPPSPSKIDALIAKTNVDTSSRKGRHRRIQSGSDSLRSRTSLEGSIPRSRNRSYTGDSSQGRRRRSISRDLSITSQEGGRSTPLSVLRVPSFGEMSNPQPSLLEQGRMAREGMPPKHHRVPSGGGSSVRSYSNMSDAAGGMPQDDIERAFSNTMNEMEIDPIVGSQVMSANPMTSKRKGPKA